MISVSIFSHRNLSLDNVEYIINNSKDMERFLTDLITKIKYGGERICLENATIHGNLVDFTEIKRW